MYTTALPVQAGVIPTPKDGYYVDSSEGWRLISPAGGLGALDTIWGRILSFSLLLFGALALVYLILNAIRYMSSNGDPKKTQEARNAIVYSVIAIIIVVASFFILNAILGLATDIIDK